MTAETTHTCSYYCERPECVRRQRDELRDRLEAVLAQQPPSAPVGANVRKAGEVSPYSDVVLVADLSQQPAAAGEEIMVNAAHGVFTLPLQPSGRSIGPRFVVHVPLIEAPAVKALQAEIEALRAEVNRFRALEAEAAEFVEVPIINRTKFTGDEPYVGWRGLGQALNEALDERDALRAEVEAWRELSDHVRVGACNAIWPDRYVDERIRDVAAALKRAERLAEALAGLITWIPSEDTYRRLGFDPEAPMRALRRARAAVLWREAGND